MAHPVRTSAFGRAAARRIFAVDVVGTLGWGLAVTVPLSLALVVLARVFPGLLPLSVPALSVAPAVLGAAAAVVVASLRRPGVSQSLRAADQRLDLKDRLATAYELSESPDPFVPLAIADAESRTDQSLLHRAFPMRFGTAWYVAGTLAAVVLAAAIWMPARNVAPRAERARPTAEQVAQASTQIRAATDALKELAPPEAAATSSELANLAEIERDLAEGNLSPEEARARSAATMNQAAERAEETAAATDESTDRSIRDLATAARRAPGEDGSPANQIARSLAQGDARSAAEAAQRALEASRSLSPPEREAMANELLSLAKELDEAQRRDAEAKSEPGEGNVPAGESPAPGSSEPAGERQPPRDQGQPSDGAKPQPTVAKNPADAGQPPSSTEQKPPVQGPPAVNEEATREAEQRPAAPQKEEKESPSPSNPRAGNDEVSPPKDASEKVTREKTDKLSKALRDAAKQLKQPEKNESLAADDKRQSPGDAPTKSEGADAKPGAERKDGAKSSKPDPGGTPQDSRKEENREPRQGDEVRNQEGADSTKRPPSETVKPASGDQNPAGEKSDNGEKGRNARQGQPQQTPGQEAPPAGESRDGEKPTQPGEPQPSSKNGKESQPPAAGAKEGKAPDTKPGNGQEKQDQPGSGEQGQGLERVARELKELADRRGRAAEDRERARELRREAQRLLEQGRPPETAPQDATPESQNSQDRGADRPPAPGAQGEQGTPPGQSPRSPGQGSADPARRDEGERRNTGGTGQAGDSAGKNPREPKLAPSGATELVDARATQADSDSSSKNPGMPVSPGPDSRQPLRSSTPAALNDRIREAAVGAERAVEQQAVPSQYSPFVKRVFRRYVDRVGSATPGAAPQAPATPDAPDAPRGPKR